MDPRVLLEAGCNWYYYRQVMRDGQRVYVVVD